MKRNVAFCFSRLTLLGLSLLISLASAQAQSGTGVAGQNNAAPQGSNNQPVSTLTPHETGHIKHLDFKNGFRTYKFGTNISEFSGLKIFKDLGPLKIYTRESEDLTIADARVSSIVYRFFNGKLMDVGLYTNEPNDTNTLMQVAEMAYGHGTQPPTKPDAMKLEFYWTGTVANARFIQYLNDGKGELWIGNNALQDEYGKYQLDQVNKAAREF